MEDHELVTKLIELSDTKAPASVAPSSLSPSDDDLKLINEKYAVSPLGKDEISTLPVFLANNLKDRDGERFSMPTLRRLAETLPGKSFLSAHQHGPAGMARFYKADIQEKDGVNWLVGHIYALNKHHGQMLDEMRAGTWWATSIAFKRSKKVPLDGEGKEIPMDTLMNDPSVQRFIDVWEFREDETGKKRTEAIEGSLVHLGSQRGAAIGRPADIKSAIKFKKHPLAPLGTTWDAGAEVAKADVNDLKEMCAWCDADNADSKAAYKFPHHTADGLKTVFAACANGMARLNQSSLSGSDRRAVYNHLAAHYREFEKEPPAEKAVVEEPDMEDNKVTKTSQAQTQDDTALKAAQEEIVQLKAEKAAREKADADAKATADKKSTDDKIAEIAKTFQDKLDAQQKAYEALQKKLDDLPSRKGMRVNPDEDGYIKVKATQDTDGGLILNEEETAKAFVLDRKTGLPTKKSVSEFYRIHSLTEIDQVKNAQDPEQKSVIMDNLETLFVTAWNVGLV